MTATTRARVRRSPDEMRAALIEIGLHEEEKPLTGFAFTYWKYPASAVQTYRDTHGGAEAIRFYLHPRMFVLAE